MINNMADEKLLKAIEVAYILKITIPTLTNWYNWYNGDFEKPDNTPELPTYVRYGKQGSNKRGARFWKESDIPKLIKFQAWIKKGRNGVMSDYNRKFWTAYNKKKAGKENG